MVILILAGRDSKRNSLQVQSVANTEGGFKKSIPARMFVSLTIHCYTFTAASPFKLGFFQPPHKRGSKGLSQSGVIRRAMDWSLMSRDRKSTRLNSSHLGISYA